MFYTNSSRQADVNIRIKQERVITDTIYSKVDIKSEKLLRFIYLLVGEKAQLIYNVS
jgi:hypothetical protein